MTIEDRDASCYLDQFGLDLQLFAEPSKNSRLRSIEVELLSLADDAGSLGSILHATHIE